MTKMQSGLTDEQLMTKIRFRLIKEEPFWGVLALGLQPIVDKTVETLGTDGTVLRWNPLFFRKWSEEEQKGLVAHEVSHVAYRHLTRRRRRDPNRWNIAGDLVINKVLLESAGMKLPAGTLDGRRIIENHGTEEVYDMIKVIKQDGCGPGCQGEAGKSGGKSGGKSCGRHVTVGIGKDKISGDLLDNNTGSEQSDESPGGQEQEQKWRGAVIRAAEAARLQGKLPAGVGRLIDEILNPTMPWQDVLAEFVIPHPSDYTFLPTDRRFHHTGFFMPNLNGDEVEGIVVAIDTSGSISQEDMRDFFGELMGILHSYPQVKGRIIFCDAAIAEGAWLDFDVETTVDEIMAHNKGGGGTDFRPVFDHIVSENLDPKCLIFFTDAYGSFPSHEPDYPVLWIVKGDGKTPWGRTTKFHRDEA